jgi:hypothetical protein
MDPTQLPLRDLHLPAAIGWWPLAPGWWVLLALLAAGLGWLTYRALQRWQAGRSRRFALQQLLRATIEYGETGNTLSLAKQLSELLRRAMLAYAPRSEVAGLTGDRWLQWLDQGMNEPLFSTGAGQVLESLPYRSPEPGDQDIDVDGLIDAVRERLRTPVGSAG